MSEEVITSVEGITFPYSIGEDNQKVDDVPHEGFSEIYTEANALAVNFKETCDINRNSDDHGIMLDVVDSNIQSPSFKKCEEIVINEGPCSSESIESEIEVIMDSGQKRTKGATKGRRNTKKKKELASIDQIRECFDEDAPFRSPVLISNSTMGIASKDAVLVESKM